MNNSNPLFSEMFRPQTLADLFLPAPLLNSLQKMVDRRSILNLLFYGQPGIGKTSAARILLKLINADAYEINGSFNHGDKSMVKQIEGFSQTVSLFGQPKICVIDEADFMSKDVQAALRYIIENASDNVRFLLTANDVTKLSPAMRSRCTPICFDVPPVEIGSVISRMTARYIEKLKAMNITADPKRINEIVSIYFPDLRNIANHLELEFA